MHEDDEGIVGKLQRGKAASRGKLRRGESCGNGEKAGLRGDRLSGTKVKRSAKTLNAAMCERWAALS